MDQPSTYTVIQRNEYGQAVNTITGMSQGRAEMVVEALSLGDAYQGEQPWTCEIVREPSREEQLAAVVDQWLADAEALTRADHLVACLRHVADVMEPLGDKAIPRTGLKVELHLFSHAASNAVRIAALDELAAVFGLKGELNEAGHYHTGYSHGGGLRLVTIAEPEASPVDVEPQPVDEPQLAAVEHRHGEFWKGGDGSGGQCGASCTCGTTFDGFDSVAEATGFIDRHIAAENAKACGCVEPQPIVSDATIAEAERISRLVAPMDLGLPQAPCGCPIKSGRVDHCAACDKHIPAERLDVILAELNRLTSNPDEGEADWWDWIHNVPEFDREATAASTDTGTLHLTDGTVLAWFRGETSRWERVAS